MSEDMNYVAIAAVSFIAVILVGVLISAAIYFSMPNYPFVHGPIA